MIKKKNWMYDLSRHYEKTRKLYPDGKLMILFDIDGTILDMRYMILYVLRSFDKNHGTDFFASLKTSDIFIHENRIEKFLAKTPIEQRAKEAIRDWYLTHRWSSSAILESHRPFAGVMEVIRWFQMQPNTSVGLNTGRPESIRRETMRSLNELGKEYKAEFTDELLYMNPYGWDTNVYESKISGVAHFQQAGYRIFAFIDNEPENLTAVSESVLSKDILLLHANTIYESKRKRLPASSVSGKQYDITDLIHEKSLPQHVQFVWHGVNDRANLKQFTVSNVQWAELDVRLGPYDEGSLILRHDSFEESPHEDDEDFFLLDEAVKSIAAMDRSIKLDLKENGALIDGIMETLKTQSIHDSRLWFNGNIEDIKEEGFRKLADAYPGAILQCSIDFLCPMIISTPEKARDILHFFEEWGINRFSINWKTQDMKQVLSQLDTWGFEVNIYNVPDLESFLKAVLLLPKSITSDFNFPGWHYFGRGSGENRKYYEYSFRLRRSNPHVYYGNV